MPVSPRITHLAWGETEVEGLPPGKDFKLLLETTGTPVHVARTEEAIALYNGLAATGEAVGGLFHSTC